MTTNDTIRPPQLTPRIEGAAESPTLFFMQGWPDDASVWDDMVAALRDRYRCVRFNMPNYPGAAYRRWGYTHEEIVEGVARCIREVSPDRPVTLIAHDWGAFWAYRVQDSHPSLVSRMVAMDVGPDLKPTGGAMVFTATYQLWLASAFVIGGSIGNWMTRTIARRAHSPRQGEALNASVNYPYLYTWQAILSGKVPNLPDYAPEIPLLFVFGRKKPGSFHSSRWTSFVRSRPDNEVIDLPGATHWVMLDPSLKDRIRNFLDRTNAP